MEHEGRGQGIEAASRMKDWGKGLAKPLVFLGPGSLPSCTTFFPKQLPNVQEEPGTLPLPYTPGRTQSRHLPEDGWLDACPLHCQHSEKCCSIPGSSTCMEFLRSLPLCLFSRSVWFFTLSAWGCFSLSMLCRLGVLWCKGRPFPQTRGSLCCVLT